MNSNININECTREWFKACYYDANGFGDFKGTVSEIKKNRVLFKRIYVSYWCFVGGEMTMIEGFEDHVWILDSKEIFNQNIREGDCLSFSGIILPYKRKDGTCELGIANVSNVEKNESYDLPSEEKLFEQFVQQIKCETCLFSEQCCGNFRLCS